jgi:hypothetical protein
MEKLADGNSLVLVCPDYLNSDIYAQLEYELLDGAINLHVERKPPTIYASIIWAMPTLIAVYLVKPFVETILKKAAEDAYPALKSGVTNFVHRILTREERTTEPRVSITLAIYFERSHGGWAKALLWEGLPETLQQEALESLFLLIQQDSNGNMDEDMLAEWDNSEQWGKVFLRFDLETRTWKAIDIVAESRRSKKSSGHGSE